MKYFIMFFIIFLLIGGFFVYKNNEENLDSASGKINFAIEIGRWLWVVGGNVKDTVGYAMNMDWLPAYNKNNDTEKNESNEENINTYNKIYNHDE